MSAFGTALTEIALPLLALFVVDVSAVQLGAVVAVEQVGWLLFGLVAGVWVDRWPRIRVLIVADLGRAALITVLPLAYWLGHLNLWLLLLVGLLSGVGNVFSGVAHAAVVPEIVERDALIDANARINTVDTASGLSGAAIVGPLVALLGAPAALAVDAATYLASAVLLRGVTTKVPDNSSTPVKLAAPRHFRRELTDGVAIVARDPLFRTLTLGSAAFNACVAAQYVLGFLFLRELGTPPGFFGILLAAGGVGGLLGSLAVPRLSTRFGEATVWRVALVAGPTIGLLVPLARPGLGLTAFAVGSFGLTAAVAISSIIGFSVRQALCPPALLGRVAATTRMVTWGLIPIAATAGGWLGSTIGIRPALIVIAGCFFLEPVVIRLTSIWHWESLTRLATSRAEST